MYLSPIYISASLVGWLVCELPSKISIYAHCRLEIDYPGVLRDDEKADGEVPGPLQHDLL